MDIIRIIRLIILTIRGIRRTHFHSTAAIIPATFPLRTKSLQDLIQGRGALQLCGRLLLQLHAQVSPVRDQDIKKVQKFNGSKFKVALAD